ncbi:MAG: hypothetical protein FWB93_06605 [Oscillospiraceae bacterium]|nr:hypothetical protein [Oscillospiraceae bacterium]
MAEPISMTLVVKKVAVKALTSKKLRNVVIGTVLGVLLLLVAPIAFLFGVVESGQSLDWDCPDLRWYVYENMPPEGREQIEALGDLMEQIAYEVYAQQVGLPALTVQIFFLGLMYEHPLLEYTIAQFVGCFVLDEEDEYACVFVNLYAAFGIWLTEEDQEIMWEIAFSIDN